MRVEGLVVPRKRLTPITFYGPRKKVNTTFGLDPSRALNPLLLKGCEDRFKIPSRTASSTSVIRQTLDNPYLFGVDFGRVPRQCATAPMQLRRAVHYYFGLVADSIFVVAARKLTLRWTSQLAPGAADESQNQVDCVRLRISH